VTAVRWLLAVVLALAGTAAFLFLTGDGPRERPARVAALDPARRAPEAEPRSGASGGERREALWRRSAPGASAEAPASRPAVGSGGDRAGSRTPRPDPVPDAQLEEELGWTEEAIAASHQLADRAGAAPAQSGARSRAAPAPAAPLECKDEGHACLSAAECCPGLACAGGVAGFGTRGRCEAPR